MNKCSNCGFENDEDNIYCMRCAKKITVDVASPRSRVMDDRQFNELYYTLLINGISDENKNQSEEVETVKTNKEHGFKYYLKEYLDIFLCDFNTGFDIHKFKSTRHQLVATILSTVVIGLGFFYLDDFRKFITYFSTGILILILARIFSVFNITVAVEVLFFINMILYIYGIYATFIEASLGGKIHEM